MKPYFETKLGMLYCGDCVEIIPMFNSFDLVLTDPPYGVGKADWDKEYISVEHLVLPIATGVIINCGDQNIASCISAMGDKYRGLFYGWNMNGMTRGPLGYMNVIPAVCGGKLKRGMNFCKFSIQDRSRKNHPSPKPIEFYMAILQRFGSSGDTVLDCFMGSGTTAVACERLDMNWVGVEISERYCEIAAKRIEQETRQMKLF